MKLTAKQELFAQCIADGMKQADAFRKAYDAQKMQPSTIWEKASRISSDSKVSARIAELKEALQAKGLWTRQKSVEALSDIAGTGRAMEVVAAVKELNSMHGFNEPAKLDVRVSVGRIELVALK